MNNDQLEIELQRLHPESFGWALCCCGRNRNEAEDVMQQAYVKVLEGSARFEGRSSFRTWLFGVIRRTASERRRRSAIQDRILSMLFIQRAEVEAPGPDRTTEYSERSRQLLDALKMLSKRQSEVLQLAFYHDMSLEEVARVLDLSIGSTRTHYSRGKQNLARHLLAGEQGRPGL